MQPSTDSTARSLARLSGGFVLVALAALWIADIHLYRPDPWQELGRIGLGLITVGNILPKSVTQKFIK